MKNENLSLVTFTIGILIGCLVMFAFLPQQPIKTVTEVVYKEKPLNEIYIKCLQTAHTFLNNPSFWTGESQQTVSAQEMNEFIDHCIEKSQ